MSKKIEYKCNLCNQTIEPKNILSYYWDNKTYVLTESLDASGTHICTSCIECVKGSPILESKRMYHE